MSASPELVERQPHWYRTTTHECPVCGAGETYRERIYGNPPERFADERYVFEHVYDYCLEREAM